MEDLLTSFILSSLGGGGEGWEARKYKNNLHFTNQADIKKCRGAWCYFYECVCKNLPQKYFHILLSEREEDHPPFNV